MSVHKFGTNSFRKYFTVISLIIILCFIILGIALLGFVSNYWQDQNGDMLSDNAKSLSKMTNRSIDQDTLQINQEAAVFACNALDVMSTSINADAFIVNLKGEVILCKEKSTSNGDFNILQECEYHKGKVVDDQLLNEIISSGDYIGYHYINNAKTKSHLAGVPLMVQGKAVGAAIVAAPVSNLRPFMMEIFKNFLLSAILALALAFVFIYLMTYQMIKPLRSMSAATRSFAKGDFSYRVRVVGNDEMAELASAFNAMAQSLATTEASRRNFVANVSHELKTPMTTIGGFIDGILDGTIPPEKQEYYLKIVSDEVKRLSRLVKEMLNMSKIEAGEMKIKPTSFDISEKMFRILVSFEQVIDKKCIEIRGFDQIQGIVVEADEDSLHQVLYNLIDNAVKFTNEGGYIQVNARIENENAVISIRNSGEGISSEELSRVFERFYKVDKSRSKDVKGTGLGLYIVKNIIEMHGGNIVARSEQGEYSEFEFRIPLKFQTNQ